MQNHFTICPLHPDLPPSFFLVWLRSGGAFPKFNRLYLVSKVNLHELRVWMDFAFDLCTTLYFEALVFSESTACVSGHCVANVSGVQHRENGPTPSTGPNKDEGHLLFSFALTRSTYFGVVIILYWGFLRAIRSVLRLRLTIPNRDFDRRFING